MDLKVSNKDSMSLYLAKSESQTWRFGAFHSTGHMLGTERERYIYKVTTFKLPKIYGFLNIRTGILDYLWECVPWPGHLSIRNSICLHIHLNIQMELVFHTTSGASRSRPPSTYLNVVAVYTYIGVCVCEYVSIYLSINYRFIYICLCMCTYDEYNVYIWHILCIYSIIFNTEGRYMEILGIIQPPIWYWFAPKLADTN